MNSMRIIIEKKLFSDAVHIASRFAQKGSATLPALSSILLLAGDDGIKIRATNLETGIDLKLKGEQKGDGVIAIPAQLLGQLASSFFGEGSIIIEHSGDTATVSSGGAKSVIKTVSYEDFPSIPFPESPKNRLVLPGALVRSTLTSIASCASTSSIRPELASVYVSIEGGVLTAVATDSFRLAEKKIPLSNKAAPAKVLLPAKNVLEIAQAIPNEDIIVSFDDHQCAFVWDSGMVVTRLTAAVYPDYRQIIPKDTVVEATMLKRDLEAALKRAAIFSDTFQKIRLSFDPKKKTFGIYARNADAGESSEIVPATVSGNQIELSFNHRYLQALLPLTGAESVTLKASGIGRPLTIRGVGDASLLYLVMPMNQ